MWPLKDLFPRVFLVSRLSQEFLITVTSTTIVSLSENTFLQFYFEKHISKLYYKKYNLLPQVPCSQGCHRKCQRICPDTLVACTCQSLQCECVPDSLAGCCQASGLCNDVKRFQIYFTSITVSLDDKLMLIIIENRTTEPVIETNLFKTRNSGNNVTKKRILFSFHVSLQPPLKSSKNGLLGM